MRRFLLLGALALNSADGATCDITVEPASCFEFANLNDCQTVTTANFQACVTALKAEPTSTCKTAICTFDDATAPILCTAPESKDEEGNAEGRLLQEKTAVGSVLAKLVLPAGVTDSTLTLVRNSKIGFTGCDDQNPVVATSTANADICKDAAAVASAATLSADGKISNDVTLASVKGLGVGGDDECTQGVVATSDLTYQISADVTVPPPPKDPQCKLAMVPDNCAATVPPECTEVTVSTMPACVEAIKDTAPGACRSVTCEFKMTNTLTACGGTRALAAVAGLTLPDISFYQKATMKEDSELGVTGCTEIALVSTKTGESVCTASDNVWSQPGDVANDGALTKKLDITGAKAVGLGTLDNPCASPNLAPSDITIIAEAGMDATTSSSTTAPPDEGAASPLLLASSVLGAIIFSFLA